jgi:hypothetical protein
VGSGGFSTPPTDCRFARPRLVSTGPAMEESQLFRMTRAILPTALFVFAATSADAQILNTLSGFDDTAGWQGEASAFVRVSGGNTDVQNYFTDAAGQWQGDRQRIRAIVGYELSRNDGRETSEALTAHLRHNYRIRQGVSTIAFSQFQRNPFQNLRARILLGGGLRFDLVSNEKRRFAIGMSGMFESEELTDARTSTTTRLSTFLDFTRDLKQYLRFAIVGWYQPDLSDVSDTRASAIADLDIDLVGPLVLVTGATFKYDSQPPDGIKEIDWSVRTGLKLSF